MSEIHKSPKITFGMIVLNGEPFIKYQLEALYPHAYQILIAEGAVERFSHAATTNGHSLDSTVEIIKEFPDPENKIKLIQKDGFYKEKDEICNAYMPYVQGDILWQVDVDEFYFPEDIEKIRKCFLDDEWLDLVVFKVREFYADVGFELSGGVFNLGSQNYRRVFRFYPGDSWLTHRPPTLQNQNGQKKPIRRMMSAEISAKLGVRLFHYSYILKSQVLSKSEYYAKIGRDLGWDDGHHKADSWSATYLNKFDPLRVYCSELAPSYLVEYSGDHPEPVRKMLGEIDIGECNRFDDKYISEIHKTINSPNYSALISLADSVGETYAHFYNIRLFHFLACWIKTYHKLNKINLGNNHCNTLRWFLRNQSRYVFSFRRLSFLRNLLTKKEYRTWLKDKGYVKILAHLLGK